MNFTNTSTGSGAVYAWDFNNDGQTDSTDQSPSFTYTAPGTYVARLTASNSGGSTTKQETITVNPVQITAPVASFTVDVSSGTAPLAVAFTNTSTGTIDSLAWDFNGDGTADATAGNTQSFTYSAEGTYTVSLTVTNAGGSNTFTGSISVSAALPAAPIANFTTDVSSG
ncbi:MAG: PKD domain-containing protein, partial [Anaerolineae bacterium]|nr:PKD domain-containing protein [Anaerolineae bacterium]